MFESGEDADMQEFLEMLYDEDVLPWELEAQKALIKLIKLQIDFDALE